MGIEEGANLLRPCMKGSLQIIFPREGMRGGRGEVDEIQELRSYWRGRVAAEPPPTREPQGPGCVASVSKPISAGLTSAATASSR